MELPKYSKAKIAQFKRDAVKYVLPHFADNADLAKDPKIFLAGEGAYLYDIEGNCYLDTFASLLTTICGHHRPEIIKAIDEQAKLLEFFPNYHDTFTVPLVNLARKLDQIMPGDLSVSFFVNSGTEANETAVKMARQYHRERGQPDRYKIMARRHSYSGTTLGAGSFTGIPWFHEYFEPPLPGCIFAPAARCNECELDMNPRTCRLACLRQMDELIKWEGPNTISCIIMDPIPGSNVGYPLPPKGYLKGVRELCDKYGIVLIFDEVQTGFGKTGKWFACEHWNVVPDIITIGKGFTGGYIPLAAAVARRKIGEVFMKKPGSELRSGSTYGGHTIACAATLANIAIIEKEGLVKKVARVGKYLEKRLKALYKYPIVGDVRGIGFLWAVELMADRKKKTPLSPPGKVGTWIRDYCWDHGMILRNNGDILVYAPALIMTEEQIDHMLDLSEEAIVAAVKHFKVKKPRAKRTR